MCYLDHIASLRHPDFFSLSLNNPFNFGCGIMEFIYLFCDGDYCLGRPIYPFPSIDTQRKPIFLVMDELRGMGIQWFVYSRWSWFYKLLCCGASFFTKRRSRRHALVQYFLLFLKKKISHTSFDLIFLSKLLFGSL